MNNSTYALTALYLFLSLFFPVISASGSFDALPDGHWLPGAYSEVTDSAGRRMELPPGTSRFGAVWRMADALERLSPQDFSAYRRQLNWEFSSELALIAARTGPARERSHRQHLPEIRFDRIIRPLARTWPRRNELPAYFSHFFKVDFSAGRKSALLALTDVALEGHRSFSRMIFKFENPDILGSTPARPPEYRLQYDGFRNRIRMKVSGIRQDLWFYHRGALPLDWMYRKAYDPLIRYVRLISLPEKAEIWVDMHLREAAHVNVSNMRTPADMAVDMWQASPEDYKPLWRVRIDEPVYENRFLLRQDTLSHMGFDTDVYSDSDGRLWLELLGAYDTLDEARLACMVLNRYNIKAFPVQAHYY